MRTQSKVVIIGAGHVGSHCAYSLAALGVCNEIVLLDIVPDLAKSHAADIADGVTLLGSRPLVRHGDYDDCRDADIVVISAGVSRKPGQTRLDMLGASIRIMQDIAPKLTRSGFGGILVTISNPADIVADYLRRNTGLPKSRVFSTGTSLDSARLRRILSEMYGVDRASVSAYSMGEHGDSQMIPFSAITVGGMPLNKFDPNPPYAHILERTRLSGMDIVIGKGSTEFGIGTVLAGVASAVLSDAKTILPLSVLLEGEYGISGIHAGVPCLLGRNGIEKVLEIPLTEEEQRQLETSAGVIAKHCALAQEI